VSRGTTKEAGKGTGVGLSTVLGIVKTHNGFLDVSRRPGLGTTFKVFFPSMAGQARAEQLPPDAVGEPHGQGELILVVDDDLRDARCVM
jgi:hypothetical protein